MMLLTQKNKSGRHAMDHREKVSPSTTTSPYHHNTATRLLERGKKETITWRMKRIKKQRNGLPCSSKLNSTISAVFVKTSLETMAIFPSL
jgi:hypothetical protein